jgi:hypothetical protein
LVAAGLADGLAFDMGGYRLSLGGGEIEAQ